MFYLFYPSQESSEFIKLKPQEIWTCPGQLFALHSQQAHFPYFSSYPTRSSDTAQLFYSRQAQAICFYGLVHSCLWILHRLCQESFWLLLGMSFRLWDWKRGIWSSIAFCPQLGNGHLVWLVRVLFSLYGIHLSPFNLTVWSTFSSIAVWVSFPADEHKQAAPQGHGWSAGWPWDYKWVLKSRRLSFRWPHLGEMSTNTKVIIHVLLNFVRTLTEYCLL